MVSPTDPNHTLNTLVWNTRGILSSTYELSYLLDQYSVDLAPICEHKLFSLGLIHKQLQLYICRKLQYKPIQPSNMWQGRTGTINEENSAVLRFLHRYRW